MDSNYIESNINFFLNWLDNCFSTLNRVYNPSSFKKKSCDAVEYYRINNTNISFCTDKIIDIIRKHANVQNPNGNTVKEMREFLEALSRKIEIVKKRYEENNIGIEFKFKVRIKHIPNFLLNFLVEHADSNEETTQREAIRISDHNTGIGMAGKLTRFIDYMSIIESYQDIKVSDISKIFNNIIEVLKTMDEKAELSFGQLKYIFGEMLENTLLSIEKKFIISEIIDDEDYEEKIYKMIMDLRHTKYGGELYREMKKNMGNIKKIRRVLSLILNGELERLVEEEKNKDDLLIVTSYSWLKHTTDQQESLRAVSKYAAELPIEIMKMFNLKKQMVTHESWNGESVR